MVFVVASTIQKTIYVEESRQGRRSSMTSRVDSCFGEAGLRRSASPSRALRRNESPSRVVKSSVDVPCFPGKATGEPDKTYIAVLFMRTKKVFKEKMNLLVRFGSRGMPLAVSHGNPIHIPEKPVDFNGMINSFPTLRPIL
ncbi:hypothetical protein ES707_22045 [subsurface metagenome]